MAHTAKLLTIQGGKCFYCGKHLAIEDATIDHVIPKALGGDNSDGNAVVCCVAINQAFGHATPKEKLTALINGGGRLECPKKTAGAPKAATSSSTKPVAYTAPGKPLPLAQPVKAAFSAAAAVHGGQKANLSAVATELRKRVPGFNVKEHGHKQFNQLIAALGYRIDGHWCYPRAEP